jgi:hypothetical protein
MFSAFLYLLLELIILYRLGLTEIKVDKEGLAETLAKLFSFNSIIVLVLAFM